MTIVLVLSVAMLCGCSLRCEPTGRVLWGNVAPMHFPLASGLVDGAMGGVDCDVGWVRR